MSRASHRLATTDLITVTNYTLKQDMDLKNDRWMHMPISTGLAIYAYDYIDKANRRYMEKK